MNRRAIFLIVLLLVVAGPAAYLLVSRDEDPAALPGPLTAPVPTTLLDAREALPDGPKELTLNLTVDVPPGSDFDKPDHQEMSAEGLVDFAAGDADLVYDYQGLANVAGLLGHFDTMDILYVEGKGFVEAFVSGPPWLSIVPHDAANSEVQRLREVMLTTPMLLPSLLDRAELDEGDISAKVDLVSLSKSDDDLAAGIGDALRVLEASSVRVDLGPDGSVAISFDYLSEAGRVDVRASYRWVPTSESVSVEAPDAASVRPFATTVG